MVNEIFQRKTVIVENQLGVGRSPSESIIGIADFVSSTDSNISIISGTGNISRINFGNSDINFNNAVIEHNHSLNETHIKINNVDQLIIDSSGTTITGNLTVQGTTTTVNSSTLQVTDNIILVNQGETGAGVSLITAGLEVDRGTLTNAQWMFDETNLAWSPSGITTTIHNNSFFTSGNTTLGSLQPTDNNHLTRKDYVDSSINSALSGSIGGGIDNRIVRYNGANAIQPSLVEINDNGQFLGIAGSVIIPSYSFIGDPNTGLSNLAPDTIDISTNGASRITISNTECKINNIPLTVLTNPTLGTHVGNMDFNDDRYIRDTISNLGGLVTRITATGESEARSILVGAGLTIANSNGVAGDPFIDVNDFTITLSGDLTGSVTITDLTSATLVGAVVDNSHSHDLQYFNQTISDGRYLRRDNTTTPTINASFDLGSTTFKWNNIYATTFNGTATAAQYADLAERYSSDEPMKEGDVVVFGGEAEITLSTKSYDTAVAGVISKCPAFMMNSEVGDNLTHPYVALKGKVFCKVIGKIKKGDLIVTSSLKGHGMSAGKEAKPYTAFARSLEDFEGNTGIIYVSII